MGFRIFAFFFGVSVLPVSNDDIPGEFFVKLAQFVFRQTANDVAFPPFIPGLEQHIVPHDDPRSLFGKKIVEIADVIPDKIFQLFAAAIPACSDVVSFITADVEEGGIIVKLIKFQHKIGQHPAGLRIGQTPCPPFRFKKALQ